MTENRRATTSRQADRGFTLIELLIVVAIIGIIAALAVPGLLSARRSGNQASAIASLRTISSAQRTFATSCGFGAFATALPQLATPPPLGGEAFISPDLGLGAVVTKSGYIFRMAGGADGTTPGIGSCNGVAAAALSSTFYASAEPETPGTTGMTFYWLGVAGTIFEDQAAIPETNGLSSAPGGTPIQ